MTAAAILLFGTGAFIIAVLVALLLYRSDRVADTVDRVLVYGDQRGVPADLLDVNGVEFDWPDRDAA